MRNLLKEMGQGAAWRLLVSAAKRGAVEHGLTLSRKPGRGLSNVWDVIENGRTFSVSIRTTRDRYIAFPPLEGGRRWKTLDDVDKVLVATVDNPDHPVWVEVYLFEAADVRNRFSASYAARIAAQHVVTDNFGMWLCLDEDSRNTPISVGTGIVEKQEPIARYKIEDLVAQAPVRPGPGSTEMTNDDPGSASDKNAGGQSIGEIIGWARERIASAASVPVEAVKLDLRIEYR